MQHNNSNLAQTRTLSLFLCFFLRCTLRNSFFLWSFQSLHFSFDGSLPQSGRYNSSGLFGFSRCIPESVRWQLTHGRVKNAEDSLTRVAKFNRKGMPSEHLGFPEEKKPTKEATFLDLFRSKSMTKKTLISWFSW